NFSEFNAEDYADDQEAPLEELFDHLDHFINYLQYDNINIDQFLPAGATLIKHDKNPPRSKSIEGIEYSIPPDTDFHKWVQEFGKSTGAPYVKRQIFHNEGNVSLQVIYKYHRAGTYQSTTGKDQSIKEPRPNQKPSKKCDCKSRIIVANTNTPNGKQMIIKYTPYTNHIPGSDNDIGTLRLSKKIRNWITEHIRDGLNVKGINRLFQKRARDMSKGKLFGFTVPICKEIIHDISVILLDATHGTNKHKDLLYTLLFPDPKTGKGITLAHLISSRKNFESVQYWFYNLRAQFPDWQGPTAFLVDCDMAQIKALRVVFPEKKTQSLERKLTSDEKRSLESELFEDL
ncbi:27972_t:CDS:2, partial [Racocetra persica]